MSQFYDQASLVMVPSGYKAGKVYSQKPLSTDGELTFTRNSNATRVNADGLVEKVRTNLLLQSNTFNTTWSAAGATLTSGQSGYDGSSNAWLFTSTANYARITQSAGPSGVLTFSAYFKAGTTDWAMLRLAGTGYNITQYFDLTNGVIGSLAGISASINSVGGGWYRCEVTANAVASVSSYIYSALGDGNLSVTNETIYIQDAQLETGDIATDYIATTSAAVSVGPTANVPRLNYSNGCPSLLLEPQRTNVCLWSESIDNAGWSKVNTPTITTNIATAPDGYGGADGIQDTDGLAFRRVSQSFSVSANSTCTISVFVKKETSETNYGGLSFDFTGGTRKLAYIIVDAVNGTAINSTSSTLSATTTVTDFGNYWRISATTTDNGTNTSCAMSYYATIATAPSGSASLGAGSVRTVWGFQMEIGASYATSYISTQSASVTRLADAAYKTGISSLIGQTEGTMFLDFVYNDKGNQSVDAPFISLRTPTNSGFIIVYRYSSTFAIRVFNGGSNQFFTTYSVDNDTRLKLALAYKENDFALYINGSQVLTDNAGTVPATSVLDFNNYYNGVNQNISKINQILLTKTRLPNSDLATLTSL